jgi:hypothetical protein
MARGEGRSFGSGTGAPQWTWRKLRQYMNDRYGGQLPEAELRALEVKWRKIFAAAGWSVKGE